MKTEEGAAHGAAILAGVGAGNWRSVDEACDAVVQRAEEIRPDPKDSEMLNKAYAMYRRIYPALHEISNRATANSAPNPRQSPS